MIYTPRMQEHDMEQARRRTIAQNETLVRIMVEHPDGDSDDTVWAYIDVPPEGGDFELSHANGERWVINREGEVIEHDDVDPS